MGAAAIVRARQRRKARRAIKFTVAGKRRRNKCAELVVVDQAVEHKRTQWDGDGSRSGGGGSALPPPTGRINETSGHHFIVVYSRPSDVKWDRVVVFILDVREGEDINATVELLEVKFAEELEKNKKSFKRGEEFGMKAVCRYAYINN